MFGFSCLCTAAWYDSLLTHYIWTCEGTYSALLSKATSERGDGYLNCPKNCNRCRPPLEIMQTTCHISASSGHRFTLSLGCSRSGSNQEHWEDLFVEKQLDTTGAPPAWTFFVICFLEFSHYSETNGAVLGSRPGNANEYCDSSIAYSSLWRASGSERLHKKDVYCVRELLKMVIVRRNDLSRRMPRAKGNLVQRFS